MAPAVKGITMNPAGMTYEQSGAHGWHEAPVALADPALKTSIAPSLDLPFHALPQLVVQLNGSEFVWETIKKVSQRAGADLYLDLPAICSYADSLRADVSLSRVVSSSSCKVAAMASIEAGPI
jgi:hypothetical protein